MNWHKLIILNISLILLLSGCSQSGIEFTGVVRNGMDGTPVEKVQVKFSGSKISAKTDKNGKFSLIIPPSELGKSKIKIIDSIQYILTENDQAIPYLTAQKEGYQSLHYTLHVRTNSLALNILPNPIEYNSDDYTGENISFTGKLEGEVKWEAIIDGVRTFYENRIPEIKARRELYWDRDTSSAEAYNVSVAPNRDRFRSILGAVDERVPVFMEKLNKVAETENYTIYEVQWPVLKEIIPGPPLQDWPELDVPHKVFGEGLYLEVKGKPKGYTIAVPDADQQPEELAGLISTAEGNSDFARHLAENGYNVVIPVIIDRTNRWSRGTDRSSRSWIYSQGHEMGRTVAGYEIQKLEALVDWFEEQGGNNANIGIAGYGEGGLLAFYTAALDTRIDAALVSGYFAPRERIWEEPIYRNVWGLLHEFGDAELASLIAPRSLIVEYSKVPEYDSEQNSGKKIEPPGKLWTHPFSEVEKEFKRIGKLTGKQIGERTLLNNEDQKEAPYCAYNTMNHFMKQLGHTDPVALTTDLPVKLRQNVNTTERMGRMVEQMVGHTQLLLRNSEYVRKKFTETIDDQEQLRHFFNHELAGYVDNDFLPLNARTKLFDDQPDYVCYDVVLDVLPNVSLWGIISIPKDIKKGEKRPVIVLQHGRGGMPTTALNEGAGYFSAGRKLTERGFIVFTPFGNWTGETRFRWIDRIAKPVKAGQWSTVGRQHQQLIRWLSVLPFVDTSRIALYGKSIGGQTASIIASMLPEYALSINCAYFNESARKESSIYFPASFVYHVDSEMPMWNRGHTLEYAEMANYLIYPRPFMVEHGKQDGIAPPGWVEHEYEKVKRYYEKMGKGELTVLDLHEGGHIINEVVSFPFLHKYLNWPLP